MASTIKSLMKDTAIYGLSSILGRFLNWMLVPLHVRAVSSTGEYGIISNLYAWTAMVMIILIFGLETGLFRYINQSKEPNKVYTTTLWSVGFNVLVFLVLGLVFLSPISTALGYAGNSDIVAMLMIIVAMDSFSAIPFAYLRYKKRPVRFALVKFISIGLIIFFNCFFLLACPWLLNHFPASVNWFYTPGYVIGYIFIANLISSAMTLLLLSPQLRHVGRVFDLQLWKKMMHYSFPLLLLGIAGNFNKMADKILFPLLFEDRAYADQQLGIYAACFKIAVVMVMFTQAFRYAYEPFIFNKKEGHDADERVVYASAMKYFIIFSLFIYVGVIGYLDILKHFVSSAYYAGLAVVPLVMFGEMMFGIYSNLSLWYKITDKTFWGTIFSVTGCALTVLIIIFGAPRFGFMACACASVISNTLIMLLSYFIGKKYYHVPYDLRSIGFYVLIASVLVSLELLGWNYIPDSMSWLRIMINTLLILIMLYVIIKRDIPLSQISLLTKKQ